MADPFFLPSKAAPKPGGKRAFGVSFNEVLNESDNKKKRGKASTESEWSVGDSIEPEESVDEKRIRLAKQYLETFKEENDEQVTQKLRQAFDESTGRIHRDVASNIVAFPNTLSFHKAHGCTVTATVISVDGTIAFSAAKDGSLKKWSVPTRRVLAEYPRCEMRNSKGKRRSTEITSLALTTDGKVLAVGGTDKTIRIFNVEENKLLEAFKGHRDVVSCLVFRHNTHTLYSGSYDRTLKVWNCSQMAFVETLHGHLANVNAVDALARERALSVGDDGSARVWKIEEEKQLVYSGHIGSVDTVCLINEGTFVTGGQDGNIALWVASKKSPCFVVKKPHNGMWISAITACKRTDLVCSGSGDGRLIVWKAENASLQRQQETVRNGLSTTPKLVKIKEIEIAGWINSLSFSGPILNARSISSTSGSVVLCVGGGLEHRLGRWWRVKPETDDSNVNEAERNTEKRKKKNKAKNGVCFVTFKYHSDNAGETFVEEEKEGILEDL